MLIGKKTNRRSSIFPHHEIGHSKRFDKYFLNTLEMTTRRGKCKETTPKQVKPRASYYLVG
jgi:hypothetical protein